MAPTSARTARVLPAAAPSHPLGGEQSDQLVAQVLESPEDFTALVTESC